MSPEQIVDAIISDIEGRKGIGDEWEQIDPDTQAEIRATWLALFDSHVTKHELGDLLIRVLHQTYADSAKQPCPHCGFTYEHQDDCVWPDVRSAVGRYRYELGEDGQ